MPCLYYPKVDYFPLTACPEYLIPQQPVNHLFKCYKFKFSFMAFGRNPYPKSLTFLFTYTSEGKGSWSRAQKRQFVGAGV